MPEPGKTSLRKKGVDWQGATSVNLQSSWQWLLKDLESGFWPPLSNFPPWSHDQHMESKWPSYSTFFPLPTIFLIATKAGKCHPDPKGTLPFHRSCPPPIKLKWTPQFFTFPCLPCQHAFASTLPSSRDADPLPTLSLNCHKARSHSSFQIQINVKSSIPPFLIPQLWLNSDFSTTKEFSVPFS